MSKAGTWTGKIGICPKCCQSEPMSEGGVMLSHSWIDQEYDYMGPDGPVYEFSDGGTCPGVGLPPRPQ